MAIELSPPRPAAGYNSGRATTITSLRDIPESSGGLAALPDETVIDGEDVVGERLLKRAVVAGKARSAQVAGSIQARLEKVKTRRTTPSPSGGRPFRSTTAATTPRPQKSPLIRRMRSRDTRLWGEYVAGFSQLFSNLALARSRTSRDLRVFQSVVFGMAERERFEYGWNNLARKL
jgi:hypothetical protein